MQCTICKIINLKNHDFYYRNLQLFQEPPTLSPFFSPSPSSQSAVCFCHCIANSSLSRHVGCLVRNVGRALLQPLPRHGHEQLMSIPLGYPVHFFFIWQCLCHHIYKCSPDCAPCCKTIFHKFCQCYTALKSCDSQSTILLS